MKQTTNTVLMIRPVAFAKNEQTAKSNHFQKDIVLSPVAIQKKAIAEFDVFVVRLQEKGIQVLVVEDTLNPHTPDSIFPNNWISFHENGIVAVYPMEAKNRRKERRDEVLELVEENGFQINNVLDYTEAEEEGLFLEGTGSMVLDRENKKAYCALSTRADEDLFIEFCEDFDYDPVIFTANQTVEGKRRPIYHTNVMLCIGSKFAIVCLDAIDDKKEKKSILQHLKQTKKEVITISEEQMHSFVGNMLELKGAENQVLVMSEQAHKSLKTNQLVKLEKYCYLLTVNITTIETLGGGSARCMLAEVF